MILKRSIIILSLSLLISCAVKESHPIVGEWKFIESSFPLAETCNDTTFSFTTEGLLLSSSGKLHEKKSYSVKQYRDGYLVQTRHLSDNDEDNCQGIPASLARKHPINKIYLEVTDKGHNLKLHYHPKKDNGFILASRL